LPADLLWTFNDPNAKIEAWGILPVGDFPIRGDGHSLSLSGFTAPGLTREESRLLRLKGLADGMLVPDEDYVLWFAFKDAEPQRISVAVRLVPTGSFNVHNHNEVGVTMRDGAAFKPDVLAKMTKALKDKSLAAKAPAETDGEAAADSLPEGNQPTAESPPTEDEMPHGDKPDGKAKPGDDPESKRAGPPDDA
jgi:hypothetical protein